MSVRKCATCWQPFTAGGGFVYCPDCRRNKALQNTIEEQNRRQSEERRRERRRQEIEEQVEWEMRRVASYWERDCPMCAERIKKKAKICLHCKSTVSDHAEVMAQIEEDEAFANKHSVELWQVEAKRRERQKQCEERRCSDAELDDLLQLEMREVEDKLRLEKQAQADAARQTALAAAAATATLSPMAALFLLAFFVFLIVCAITSFI